MNAQESHWKCPKCKYINQTDWSSCYGCHIERPMERVYRHEIEARSLEPAMSEFDLSERPLDQL